MSRNIQKRKKYILNDLYFSQKENLQSCYFAGLLAADGCIASVGHSISIGLQSNDKYLLEFFLKDLKANCPIRDSLSKGKFYISKLVINSYQIKIDLMKIYNLTCRKSLTLMPPNLSDENEIDAFICGYIDGDGSIFISNKNVLIISILGTKEMLQWIADRFSKILGKKVTSIRQKRKNNKNTFTLIVSNSMARSLFLHFYNVKVFKMVRKWKHETMLYCLNFKNIRYIDHIKNINDFILLLKEGLSIKQISIKNNKSYKNTHRFFTSYVKPVQKALDKGEVDIESEENIGEIN